MLHHLCLHLCPSFSVSHCLHYGHTHTHTLPILFHTHTQHHTSYFMSPCVSALSLDYNVISHYTLWALCQCSRGLKLSKSSDFCHVDTAQLDNWRWKVQNFTLPPSLSFSFRSTSPPLSLSLILAFKLKWRKWIYFSSFCFFLWYECILVIVFFLKFYIECHTTYILTYIKLTLN